jgi:hypothetical protein
MMSNGEENLWDRAVRCRKRKTAEGRKGGVEREEEGQRAGVLALPFSHLRRCNHTLRYKHNVHSQRRLNQVEVLHFEP